jgi:glycosyltransferase involved in cell wall biosynthesis
MRDALESALSQQGIAFEVLIQDGASTDRTHELVREFRDERLRLVVERDDGQADALNRALSNAKGEWIIWLNADDLLAPDAFASVAPLLGEPYEIVFGSSGLIDSDGRLFKHYTPEQLSYERLLRRGTYVFSGSTFFRRTHLLARGGFNQALHYCMDYELFLRVVPTARIIQVPHDIGYLRCHPASKSSSMPWRFFGEHWMVVRQHSPSDAGTIGRLLLGHAKMGFYLMTRPVWRSRLWLAFRPAKTL